MFITRQNMSFETSMIDYDLEAADGWTPDCNGKWDYDPTVIGVSSRVWNDGTWSCEIYCGKDMLFETKINSAGSVEEAKAAVEKWCADRAAAIRLAVTSALS